MVPDHLDEDILLVWPYLGQNIQSFRHLSEHHQSIFNQYTLSKSFLQYKDLFNLHENAQELEPGAHRKPVQG